MWTVDDFPTPYIFSGIKKNGGTFNQAATVRVHKSNVDQNVAKYNIREHHHIRHTWQHEGQHRKEKWRWKGGHQKAWGGSFLAAQRACCVDTAPYSRLRERGPRESPCHRKDESSAGAASVYDPQNAMAARTVVSSELNPT